MIRWYTNEHYLGFSNPKLGGCGLEFAIYSKTFPVISERPDTTAAGVLAERVNKLETASELLKELIGEIDDPHMTPECLFCGCFKDYLSGHYEGCIYVRAKALIESV